jgi:tetratricopeptide (TPR) repeat protein
MLGLMMRSPRAGHRPLLAVLSLAILCAAPVTAAQAPTTAETTPPTSDAAALEQAAEREAAMQHLERGKRGDPEGFQRCGEAHLAIHSRLAAGGPRAQAALFMAAQCLEAAGLWPQAAEVYERLLALYPHSQYVQQTRKYLVRGHLAVARYADAARHAERYAVLYPKDWSALDSLQIAYLARRGLGQTAQALAALDSLEAMYARKDPERAAGIFWSRRELLTGEDERLAHATTYLERHGKHGGPDRLVVAHAVIGQSLWRRACAKGFVFDTCASLHRGRPQFSDAGGRNVLDRIAARRRPSPPPPPPTCHALSMPRGHLYPRAQKGAEEAQRHLATALQIARRQLIRVPEDDVGRVREFTDAATMAAVYVADRSFEELLYVLAQVSDAPDLQPVPELLARAAGLAGKLEQQYAEIVAQQTSMYWSIAAAARLGQIAETRADALLRREVPQAATDKRLLKSYCATLREQAAPLYKAARAAYERCLERSTTSGTFTDFSRLCEEALNHLDPAGFPRTPEFTNRPAGSPSRPDVIGVQLEAPRELAPANEPL